MASSSSPRNFLYDVFTSFAGKDVRKTFLTHFFKELDRKLVTVFKDSENTRSESIWPALVHAIRSSKIAVVVFSEKYAASSWCLNELLEIIKCKEEFGQLVIPVFYGLNPSHLRDPDGDFGKCFKKTCENKTEDVKHQWRNALGQVSKIFGYHSLNWDSEAKMIEAIVNDLLDKLLVTSSKEFDNYVGLEDHFAKMSALLDLESQEVKMVGIWGTSGIGKTTIARALFSRLSRHFQGSFYIDEHFKTCKGQSNDYNMKLHLQNMFLSKILDKKDIEVDRLGVVEERLKHKKVLLFIDLDDQLVVDVLAGGKDWFGLGSRIIVITKDKHILRAHGIIQTYEVPLPPQKQALKMFCRAAFKKDSPHEGFINLANKVILLAGKLPLGLQVLGCALCGRNKEDWMDMLPRFQSDLDGQIEKTLRVGYNMLNNNKDQELFCHIACILAGEKDNEVKLLLEDCDLNVDIGLKNLVDKSLIHIGEDNIVVMHCLLQKMGEEIVRSQSNEPAEREFLVDAKDICDVLEDSIGTRKIKGISLNLNEIHGTAELRIHKETFKGLRNLKFLKIYEKKLNHMNERRLHIPEDFNYLPRKLRLLVWNYYPLKCFPSDFQPQNLVKLHMYRSKLEKLWEGTQSLTGLRTMDLSVSANLKEIPDLSLAINLEKLNLGFCSRLVHLPASIKNLNKLTKLKLHFCVNLESLPSGINLQSLYQLHLSGCDSLKSFPLISTNISELSLQRTPIENFEEFLSNLHAEEKVQDNNLKSDDIDVCSKFRTFRNLASNICVLYLSFTKIKEVSRWIEYFSSLKHLCMSGCRNLTHADLNFYKLKHLESVDFSLCGALATVCLTGYRNEVAVEVNNIEIELTAPEEASSSLVDGYFNKVKLDFTDCFKLDQKPLLQNQTIFLNMMTLPGEEVPSYFNHRTFETFMSIPIHRYSLSQPPFNFRACFMVYFEKTPSHVFKFHLRFQFKDRFGKILESVTKETRIVRLGFWRAFSLVVLDNLIQLDSPLVEGNYEFVDIEFFITDHDMRKNRDHPICRVKEWGIRVLEDICSSYENGLGNSNSDEDNMVNDGCNETEECAGSDVEAESSSKRMRLM